MPMMLAHFVRQRNGSRNWPARALRRLSAPPPVKFPASGRSTGRQKKHYSFPGFSVVDRLRRDALVEPRREASYVLSIFAHSEVGPDPEAEHFIRARGKARMIS